jgi:SET and MYND domain-containing protein 4
MILTKSNEKSVALRTEGNALYSQRKFHDALVKYNESLCWAEPGSENIGLAYANRSAIYFEMKLFERCLKNIDMARLNHYPEKNFEILAKREVKCRETMKDLKQEIAPNAWNFFKLSHPANKKIPFVVDCLKVQRSEKYGRYVITDRALKVGDILAIEEPFCKVLLDKSNFVEVPESNIYQRCSYCLNDNAMDLFPCSACCKG